MSILIDKNTRVMTQGITGKTGMFHTQTSRAYANGKACFVAGVNPKKAGEKESFTVKGLAAGKYYFAIKARDKASNQSAISNVVEATVE